MDDAAGAVGRSGRSERVFDHADLRDVVVPLVSHHADFFPGLFRSDLVHW